MKPAGAWSARVCDYELRRDRHVPLELESILAKFLLSVDFANSLICLESNTPRHRVSARFLARNLGALLPSFGEPDRDRLLPVFHSPAFAALTRSQRAAFPALHCGLDRFLSASSISCHGFTS